MANPGQADPDRWSLRLAQQAFAAVLDERPRHGRFRRAALRTAARAALSALSGDDRGLLERWLTLQWVTLGASGASLSLSALASIEPALAAAVRHQLPRMRARLDRAEAGSTVAA
ncbi:hypothetical protein [Dokdonella immobilis]|uniref:hypothetical protein n=1 Tax=Dokdonella immobilis TaxID=578942 RepID=UPI001114649A|nr:hypothetical protein [Dokdonella immobilis]